MHSHPANQKRAARREWWWIFDPRCSLRARAALLVGSGLVIFTLLLSWITGTLYRRALEPQLAAKLESLAFQVGDKLDRAVYERYRTLQFVASLGPIRDANASPAERRRVLEIVQETSPELAWLGLTDPAGRVVAATNGLFETTDAAPRPWFRSGRERPFIGSLREIPELGHDVMSAADSETSRRYLDLAVPVTAARGGFGGVLAAHLRWTWAREVQVSVVPESAAKEQIAVTVYGPGGEILLDSGTSGWTQPPDLPRLPESRRLRGSITETVDGTAWLTAYARSRGFREYRGIGWLTVVRQPVERAFAGVAALRRGIVLWGSVLAAGGAIAAWVMAGRHARRLRSVRAAAERIQEGDILSVLPRPKGESEIAAMCRALGDLVEDLRAKKDRLEAENARLRQERVAGSE